MRGAEGAGNGGMSITAVHPAPEIGDAVAYCKRAAALSGRNC